MSLLCKRKTLRTIRISFVLGRVIDIFLLAVPFFVMFTGSPLVKARKWTQFLARCIGASSKRSLDALHIF